MKNNSRVKLFKFLTIISVLIFQLSYICIRNISYENPSNDIFWGFLIISIVGTVIFSILWAAYSQNEEEARNEELDESVKKQQEQKRLEIKQAYDSVIDIWPHYEEVKIGLLQLYTNEDAEESDSLNFIAQVSLLYMDQSRWILSIVGNSEREFIVQREDNFLKYEDGTMKVLLNKDEILGLKNEEKCFSINLNQNNKDIKYINSVISGKKITTIRIEDVDKTKVYFDKSQYLERNKYHFTITLDGFKCDEINFPKKFIDDFFEKHNGEENIWCNQMYYDLYISDKLPHFIDENGWILVDYFEEFMRYVRTYKWTNEKYYKCNTDYEIEDWLSQINLGTYEVFEMFRNYEINKNIDLRPLTIKDNIIVFKHKSYKIIEGKEFDKLNASVHLAMNSGTLLESSEAKKMLPNIARAMANVEYEEYYKTNSVNFCVTRYNNNQIYISVMGKNFIEIEN